MPSTTEHHGDRPPALVSPGNPALQDQRSGISWGRKLLLCDDETTKAARFPSCPCSYPALLAATVEKLALRVVDSRKLLATLADSRRKQQAAVQAAQTACRIATMVRSRPHASGAAPQQTPFHATAELWDLAYLAYWPTPF